MNRVIPFSKHSNFTKHEELLDKVKMLKTFQFSLNQTKVLLLLIGAVVGLTPFSRCFGASFSVSRPALVVDGGKIVLSLSKSGNGDLYSFDIESRSIDRLTASRNFEGWPAYSPDGSKIIFCQGKDLISNVCLMMSDLKFASMTALTQGEHLDSAPCFSPDGKSIVFCRASNLRGYSFGGKIWDDWDLYSVNIDGSGLKQLTDQHFRQLTTPCFAGSGKIVFAGRARIPHSNSELLFLNLGITNQISRVESEDLSKFITTDPNASTTAGIMVFISNRVSRSGLYDYELWTSTLEGKKLRRITGLGSYLQYPIISPDDKFIYFLSSLKRNGNYDLMRCNLEGNDLVTLYKGVK